MADINDCLERLVATGEMSREQADEIAIDVERHVIEFGRSGEFSPEVAQREAQNSAIATQQAKVNQQRRQKSLQIIAMHKAINDVTGHAEGTRTGLMALLTPDVTRKAPYDNVYRRAQAVTKELHRRFAEAMEALRTKTLGLTQDTKTMRNMVRELFGENTGDANANVFAASWKSTAEYSRQRFNRAGGAIPKRADWGLPQWHDPSLVGKVGKEGWVETILPLLDRERMTDSSGIPLNDAELRQTLDTAYDRISTHGLVDLIPGRAGGAKLGNRRSDSRFLVFKDGDAWLAYADEFGRADLFSTLTDHMEGMAHDISLLELLGPNPEHGYRTLRDITKKEGTKSVELAMLDAVWNVVSGKTSDTASVRASDIAASVRNWITSARLGSAMLSAVSDIAFLTQTARWTGMSAVKVLTRTLKNLDPTNAEDRLFAVKLGLGADAWATRALAANRFSEVTGSGISARVADLTMRASGLSHWTDSAKKAFGMDFFSMLGDSVGRSFDELDPKLKKEFEGFGFTPEHWDAIRATDTIDFKGVKYVSVENIMAREDLDARLRQDLATKLEGMVSELTLFAVPEPDARARALLTGGLAKGTITGEMARSVGQFKSFPISVILRHVYRGMYEEGAANKLGYLGGMIVGTTVLGAVALQMKEISKGRDPRDMDDPEFWGASFLQGGGAGIYGDFLYSGIHGANRFGQGPITSMLGPGVGLMEDALKVTTGQLGDVLSDKDPNFAADLIRFSKNYVPGGSLWYGRLALERTVFDQLQAAADPKARSKFRSTRRKRKTEYNQDYWWAPGEETPRRAPEF